MAFSIFIRSRKKVKKLLQELQRPNHRIAGLDPDIWYFNIGESDILSERPAESGVVLVPSYAPSGKVKNYRRIEGGLFPAMRQQEHIIEGTYLGVETNKIPGEIAELKEMIAQLEATRGLIEAEKSNRQRTKARNTFNRIAHKLNRKLNRLKREAWIKILKAAEPLDSLGRRNPAAKMSQVTGAINRLEGRLNQINMIISRIRHRREVIVEDIIRIRALLFNVLRTFKYKYEIEDLEELASSLRRVNSKPYGATCHTIARGLDILIQNFIQGSSRGDRRILEEALRQMTIKPIYTFD
jgi:hypothetical protein